MNSIMQVQVRTRSRITMPKMWREANHIEPGDLITPTKLGNGVILMRARASMAGRLVNRLAGELRKASVKLTDLLEELRQLRK